MRNTIILLILLMSSCVFALSCPNNGRVLQVKDSIEEVFERCGSGISTKHYSKSIIVSSKWNYYITNQSNHTNTKLTIWFDHGQVANISVVMSGRNEQNLRSIRICRMPIQIGNTMNYVQSVCGNPLSQKILQSVTTEITEVKYGGISPDTLVLENGYLTGWK